MYTQVGYPDGLAASLVGKDPDSLKARLMSKIVYKRILQKRLTKILVEIVSAVYEKHV